MFKIVDDADDVGRWSMGHLSSPEQGEGELKVLVSMVRYLGILK